MDFPVLHGAAMLPSIGDWIDLKVCVKYSTFIFFAGMSLSAAKGCYQSSENYQFI